jgi:hypothetical protein
LIKKYYSWQKSRETILSENERDNTAAHENCQTNKQRLYMAQTAFANEIHSRRVSECYLEGRNDLRDDHQQLRGLLNRTLTTSFLPVGTAEMHFSTHQRPGRK